MSYIRDPRCQVPRPKTSLYKRGIDARTQKSTPPPTRQASEVAKMSLYRRGLQARTQTLKAPACPRQPREAAMRISPRGVEFAARGRAAENFAVAFGVGAGAVTAGWAIWRLSRS